MAKAIFFDEKGRYKGEKDGVHSPDYLDREDVALNPPSLEKLKNVPKRYWKKVVKPFAIIKGNPVLNDIAEMSDNEKAEVDAEIAEKQALEEAKQMNPDSLEKLVKCCFLAILKRMNYPISDFKTDVKNIWKVIG